MDLVNNDNNKKNMINNPENKNENIPNQNSNNFSHKLDEEENDNIDNIENLNINQLLIDDSVNKKKNDFSGLKNKFFKIKGNDSNIYIENVNQICTIKIPRFFKEKISIVDNEEEIMNKNIFNIVQADSIIGIFDLNDNKYLGVITSSTEIINFMDSSIYNINSIELIKITNNKESLSDINLLKNIKNIFSSKNFYYSNDYDLCLSLYDQSKIDNFGDNNNIINSKYLINSSLLKYFLKNNIPDFFYSEIIFGYIGSQKEIYLDEETHLDIIILERYFNKNIVVNNDIPGYIKQVELICVFKNQFNRNLDKIFSYIYFVSSESMKYINKFLPLKSILKNELNSFKSSICIINNINKLYDNMKIKEVMIKFNNTLLNNKINLIDFSSNLNDNSIKNFEKYIDFYSNDSVDILQEKVFWFIDINNYCFNDDECFKAIIKIIWKVIQKEINYSGLNINLGSFDNNNSPIYNRINELIMKYKNDAVDIKKSLLLKNREKHQEIIDKFFSYANIYEENKIDKKKEDEEKKENKNELKKYKILCATWNIAGIPNKNYNISELFTKNVFYNENKSPDIIVISIQEIVKLNITNILSITSNQESVNMWTKIIKSTLKSIYPKENYIELKSLNLVGIYILILIKNELKNNIFLLDYNMTKTGMYGTLGNKGFFTISMKCNNKIISFGSGHFEAGKGKNEERINTLIQLLNQPIKINEEDLKTFKNADYWIILGDLNFRIECSYEEAISFIQEKNYDALYNLDQFNISWEKNKILKKYICEKKINFDPTYKYEKESNEYAYDEDKIRVPAWTDRIFFCKKEGIKMLSYDCIKTLRYSDHRPVVGTFEIDSYIKEKKDLKKSDLTNNKVKKEKNENISINISEKDNIIQNLNNSKEEDKNNSKEEINKMKNTDNLNNNINKSTFSKENNKEINSENKDKCKDNKPQNNNIQSNN